MPADSNVFLRVKIGPENAGADISAQIASVDVHDEDRGTDHATIIMDDAAGANTDAIRQGAEIRIDMGWESEHALLFVGEVHQVQSAARSGGVGRLRFTARDFSQRLNVQPPTPPPDRREGTLKDILTALIADAPGLALGDVLIDPMPHFGNDRPPLVQAPRTAWQMIQDLAEEHNARAFVEVNVHKDDSPAQRDAGGIPRLYFISQTAMLAQDPLGTLTFCHGFGSLIEFRTEQIGSGASPSAQVAAMNPATGEPVAEQGPPHAPDPPASLSGGQTDQLRAVQGDRRANGAEAAIELANSAAVQPADRRATARVTAAPSDPELTRRLVEPDRTRLRGLYGRGLAMGTVFLRAKGSVDIDGPSSAAKGRWYIRRVNHIIEQSRPPPDARGRRSDVIRKTYRTRFEATR